VELSDNDDATVNPEALAGTKKGLCHFDDDRVASLFLHSAVCSQSLRAQSNQCIEKIAAI